MQNLVILAGNVGATPETRTTQGGTKITQFSLATSRPKRDSEGKIMKDSDNRRIEDTEWHRITCFNGVGKTVAQYVDKGQKVMVRGRIQDRKSTRLNSSHQCAPPMPTSAWTKKHYRTQRQEAPTQKNH